MIRIQKLEYRVGRFALKDVSLEVAPGEYFVLLGPTGSGKTLLIECLCGLNRVRSGKIEIDGRDVTRLPPRSREIGYLPQDYALFPHQTVRGNVGFGVAKRIKGPRLWRRLVVGARAGTTMQMVGIRHLADRLPGKLSGGEKQRTALARALAVEPKVLVLDEPVSALDEQTRDTLCREIKQLQRNSGITAIHVCHNFDEMLAVADRVGIIQQGRIVQTGTPEEILQRPNSLTAARFVRAGNLLPARAETSGQTVTLQCDGGLLLRAARSASSSPEGSVTAMVRPENIQVAPAAAGQTVSDGGSANGTVVQGPVSDVVDLGPLVRLNVTCGGVSLVVSLGKRQYNEMSIATGDRASLSIAAEDVHVIPQ